MNEFEDLERRLAARVRAPGAVLRGRVLDALEREARAEHIVLVLRAAAALLVIGLAVAGGSRGAGAQGGLLEFRAALEAGVDLRSVTPLAPPIGAAGEVR